jgi:hypothetical protein
MKVLGFILLLLIYFLPSGFTSMKTDLLTIFSIMWISFVIIFIIYEQKRKSGKNSFIYRQDIKEIPTIRSPVELGYLLKAKITSKMLGVCLMELVRKKALLLRYDNKNNDYVFIFNDIHEELTDSEHYLLDWMLKDIGNGQRFSLALVSRDAHRNSAYFISCYHEWLANATIEGTKFNYFETIKHVTEKSIGYVILSLTLAFVGFNLIPTYLTVLGLVATLILVLHTNSFYLRTTSGNDEYSRWISFSHCINKQNELHDINDIRLIRRLILYIILLGKNASQTITRVLDNNSTKFESDEFVDYAKNGIVDEICTKMNKLVPQALIISFFHVKNNGSSSHKN